MMRTYEEVIYQIENTHRFGNLPGVEVTKRILEQLDRLKGKLPFVHVAGTNGKGSVCTFMSEVLKASGLKVGTFISPHVVLFEERIAINGEMISREDVTRIGNILLDMDFGVTLTMFDYCLAMALIYFDEKCCDIAIIETGLGGKLDSTNALGVPIATVITKIGYDHVAILGNDLKSIANEKAGIIKPGSSLFMETQEPEAYDVIVGRAKESGVSYDIPTTEDIAYMSRLKLRLLGVHQWENAAVAKMASVHVLNKLDIAYEDTVIDRALEATVWPGRMEIINEAPFFMVDGAHNGHGVQALRRSLEEYYPGEKFHMIMAVMADKDYPKMVDELLPYAEEFVTVTPESNRALQAKELADFIRSKGVKAQSVGTVEEAIETLSYDAKNLAFGSLYFIGEIKEKYQCQ